MATRLAPKIYADHFIHTTVAQSNDYASSRIEQVTNQVIALDIRDRTIDLNTPLDALMRDGQALVKAAITHGRALNCERIPLYSSEISADLSSVVENFSKVDKFVRGAIRYWNDNFTESCATLTENVEKRLVQFSTLSNKIGEEVDKLNKTALPEKLIPVEERKYFPSFSSSTLQLSVAQSKDGPFSPVAAEAHEVAQRLINWKSFSSAEKSIGLVVAQPIVDMIGDENLVKQLDRHLFTQSLEVFIGKLASVKLAMQGKTLRLEETDIGLDEKGETLPIQQFYRDLFTLADDVKEVKTAAQSMEEKQVQITQLEFWDAQLRKHGETVRAWDFEGSPIQRQ